MPKFKKGDKVKLPSGKVIKILDVLESKGLYQYEVDNVMNDIFGLFNSNKNLGKKYIDIKRVDEKGVLKWN
ncbi:hypothetical protein EOM09_03630 [bacterium]|nr:hypothetical protein [bacterium]